MSLEINLVKGKKRDKEPTDTDLLDTLDHWCLGHPIEANVG